MLVLNSVDPFHTVVNAGVFFHEDRFHHTILYCVVRYSRFGAIASAGGERQND